MKWYALPTANHATYRQDLRTPAQSGCVFINNPDSFYLKEIACVWCARPAEVDTSFEPEWPLVWT